MTDRMTHAGYLYMPIYAPDMLVQRVGDACVQLGCNALVGTGLSGAMAVPMLAKALDTRFCIVRKESDRDTHSRSRFEGNMRDGDRWMFLDDLICSGKTFRYVYEMMHNHCDTNGRYPFTGAYLYSTGMTVRADDQYLTTRLKT